MTRLSTLKLIGDGHIGYDIGNLTNLTELIVESGDVNHILPRLVKLVNLRVGVDVSDDVLKNCINIKKLFIETCNISRSNFKYLTNITSLCLVETDCVTEKILKKLTNLTYLYLDCTDIADFKYVPQLQHLSIYYTDVDTESFTYLTNLTNLCCYQNDFDCGDLRHLTALVSLRLGICNTNEIKYDDLEGLTNLTELHLDDATHLSPGRLGFYLTRLQKIYLGC